MQKIEISSRTIIFTIFFLLLLKFLWLVHDIIFSLFVAFIIMSAFKPFVTFLSAKKIPRFLSAFLVYILFLGIFFYLLFLILPPLITQSTLLFGALPSIIQSLSPNMLRLLNLDSLFQYVPNIANQFFQIVQGFFSNLLFFVTTLFFGFYFLLEENLIRKFLIRFFQPERVKQVGNILDRAEKRLSDWFWGEIALMTAVGVMTFIGLSLIGLNFALALAVLAGLLEIVPNLGPVLSAVPAVLIGFSHSSFLGFTTLALYFIVQQLENNLIVPIVMKQAVGLNPIITLLALLVGGRVAGMLGVLLAIPITVLLETILIEIIQSRPTSVKT